MSNVFYLLNPGVLYQSETSEEIEELLHTKIQAALKREKALAYAFSNQVGLCFSFFHYFSFISATVVG